MEGFKPSLASQGFRVNLQNDDGAGYVGTISVGGQPVKVLFDTGSDYLAVTSSLCQNETLGKKDIDEPVFDSKTMTYRPSG